jgi:hypothetical protein
VYQHICQVALSGPSPISIFLRIGWNLGNVPHRYIFEGQGGDEFCGRMTAGLPLTESKFAVLPPHFGLDTLSSILMNDDWEKIVPGYQTFPQSFRKAIPYLLASLFILCFSFLSNVSW